jgi:hypothetical protein
MRFSILVLLKFLSLRVKYSLFKVNIDSICLSLLSLCGFLKSSSCIKRAMFPAWLRPMKHWQFNLTFHTRKDKRSQLLTMAQCNDKACCKMSLNIQVLQSKSFLQKFIRFMIFETRKAGKLHLSLRIKESILCGVKVQAYSNRNFM